jgi:hypothetical protein
MPYQNIAELLAAYQQRDFFLLILLVVVGILYWMTQRRERAYERFMEAHPGSKGQFEAWSKRQDVKANRTHPTSVICPLHKVFRDTCPPGSNDDPTEEP